MAPWRGGWLSPAPEAQREKQITSATRSSRRSHHASSTLHSTLHLARRGVVTLAPPSVRARWIKPSIRYAEQAYDPVMKRIVVRALSLYLLFAVIGRFVEEMGAVECGCKPDCWCKRPGLRTFRWVFPARHHLWTAEEKEALEASP